MRWIANTIRYLSVLDAKNTNRICGIIASMQIRKSTSSLGLFASVAIATMLFIPMHRNINRRPILHRVSVHRVAHYKKVVLLATAYDIDRHREIGQPCYRFPGKTATGVQVHPGSIAVDPRVFPFGTRFYIPGYGYGVADDTGALIRGHHVDLAIVGCRAALHWGARRVVAEVMPPRRMIAMR